MIVMQGLWGAHLQRAAELGVPPHTYHAANVFTLTPAAKKSVRDAGGNQKGKALNNLVHQSRYVAYVNPGTGHYRLTQAGIDWCLTNIAGHPAPAPPAPAPQSSLRLFTTVCDVSAVVAVAVLIFLATSAQLSD